jgi:glycosyltransferase involved in cell wall biosynthesis
MMYQKGLVSVVIPTFNYEKIIAETLESVINQTYTNLEIIVTDDGSSDNTHEIVLQYAAKDKRIIPLLSKVNEGFSKNMNKGFERCTGEFIAKLDGDDLMLPLKIEKQVAFLEKNPEYVFCLTDMEVFDNVTGAKLYNLTDKAPLASHPNDWCFYTNWFFLKKKYSFVYSSVVARSSYLLQNLWDIRIPWENESLHAASNYALDPKGKWYAMKEVLGKYRLSSNSMSQTKNNYLYYIEEALVHYAIVCAKFPQIAHLSKGRRDYFLFQQLLFDWIPKEKRKYYERLFLQEAGFVKFLYLKLCKLLFKLKLIYPLTSPFRYMYRTFVENRKHGVNYA